MITWTVDSHGYPMLRVDDFNYWIHALPVTKVQFEQFLSETNRYGDDYYAALLQLNARVSLKNMTLQNYENIFLTGVKLSEAKEYASWLSGSGAEYTLPTIKKWKEIYPWLNRHPIVLKPNNWTDLSSHAQNLWDGCLNLRKFNNLAEQLFLKDGVFEWVYEENRIGSEFGGMGRPRNQFSHVLRRPADTPTRPIDQSNRKTLKEFGIRLIRKL